MSNQFQRYRHLLLIGLLWLWLVPAFGAAPHGATPSLCDSEFPITGQSATPPARLHCVPDAAGAGRIQLVIPGLAPVPLTGVDGESLLDNNIHIAPTDLRLQWLPGPPPRYWLRYRHRMVEAAGAEVEHQRDLVVSASDTRRVQLDEWSEPYYRSNRQGFLRADERELTLGSEGSGLRALSRAALMAGWWGLDDGQLGAAWSCGNDCGEDQGGASPMSACMRECLRARLHDVNQEQTLEVRQRTLDVDGRISADRRAWARLYSPLTFAFAPRPGEQPLHLLVLDDGTAGWLVIPREAPDLSLAGSFDPAAPGPMPATNACWLYNRRPRQPADAERPWPPAPAELVRADHAVPAACCTIDTSRDGRQVLVWSARPEDNSATSAAAAPPPRLLALYDRGTGQCWSLNLARSGALGQAPYDRLGDPVFSPDGRRLGFRAQRGEARFVVVDDQPGAPYHRVSGPVFSPDGRHPAYWARDRGKEFVVLDGAPGPAFQGVGLPVFAPDGRLAYRFTDGHQWRVMVGQEPGPAFDEIGLVQVEGTGRVNDLADLVFSSTGTLAYAARRGADWFLVRGQQPGTPYRQVGLPVFSPDGTRLAFRAGRDGQEFVVIDDQPGPDHDFVGTPVFRPDGRDLAYWASDEGRECMVWDGRAGGCVAEPQRIGAPVYARGGGPPFFLVRHGLDLGRPLVRIQAGERTVSDAAGIAGAVLNRITGAAAWWQTDGGEARVVHAGRRGTALEEQDPPRHALRFGPDGRLLAHGARLNGREFIKIGDEPGIAFAEVGDPVFSPTGDRLAWRARAGAVWLPLTTALPVAGDGAPAAADPAAATAVLTGLVPRRLPHPVAVGTEGAGAPGGIIIGGSAPGRWFDTAALADGPGAAAAASNDQDGCVAVSQEWLEPGLRWRLYGFDRPLGECGGGRVTACLAAASGNTLLKKDFTDCKVKGFRTAIAGPWDGLPRRPRVLKQRGGLAPLVRRVLDAHDLPRAPVHIIAVHGIDLDGDGREELVINAANGNGEGEDRAATDYSLLLLARSPADRAPVPFRAWWPRPDSAPFEHYDPWYADANGDGVLEIFVDWEYYEGSGTGVYELKDGRPVAIPPGWDDGL